MAVAVLAIAGCGERTVRQTAASSAEAERACGLSATGSGDEGPTDYRQFARPVGAFNVLMLFVDFSDAPATDDLDARLQTFSPARQWWQTASYGRLDMRLQVPVRRWVRMPKPVTGYPIAHGWKTAQAHEDYVADAVHAAKRLDPALDPTGFQTVNVIATLNVHGIDSDAVTAAYTLGVDEQKPGRIPRAATLFGQEPGKDYRVLAHENGHLFGLPDLYPGGDSEKVSDNTRWVGEFGMPGSPRSAAQPGPRTGPQHQRTSGGGHLPGLHGQRRRCPPVRL